MKSLLSTVYLLAATVFFLGTGVGGQCRGFDIPACLYWISNGFCTNANFSMEYRELACGVGCGFCEKDENQTTVGGGSPRNDCVDANANCANWEIAVNYCTRKDFPDAIKLKFCCKTCSSIINAMAREAPTTTMTSGTDVKKISPESVATRDNCKDKYPNCAKMNAAKNFCSQKPNAMTLQYCCKTCSLVNNATKSEPPMTKITPITEVAQPAVEGGSADGRRSADLSNADSRMMCFVGRGPGNNPFDFPPRECTGENERFCYTEYITINGNRIVRRGCGNDKCSEEGFKDVVGGKRYCCKERLCNVIFRTFTGNNPAEAADLL